MRGFPALFVGLVDDAAMFPPGTAEVAEALAAHREYRRSWFASMVGPLVVSDQKLAELGRALQRIDDPSAEVTGDLDVSVVGTNGAGGLVGLAGRLPARLRLRAVESALRDLDDLAGDASQAVAAAGELDAGVQVFVELPYAPGWERAVEVVAAAGLSGKLRTGGPTPADTPSTTQLAHQLRVLVEADLPFKATAGLHHAWPAAGPEPDRPRQHGFLPLLAAVDALAEGASQAEAAELLAAGDQTAVLGTLTSWSDTRSARVRRRLRSFGCCGVVDPLADLVALELLEEPR
jgi:hypothetical protein